MPKFIYTGRSADQELKKGELHAADHFAARAELESQGFTILSLTQQFDDAYPQRTPLSAKSPTSNQQSSAEQSDQQFLQDRIGTLMERRDMLVPALVALLEEMPKGDRQRRLAQVVADLQAGADPEQLATAEDAAEIWLPLLGDYSSYESNRFLCELFEETERTDAVRTRLWRIFAYPLIVFLMATAVVVFLGIVVIPSFHDIFSDFDLELPLLTQGVLELSRVIRFHPILFVLALVGLIGAVYVSLKMFQHLQSSHWGFNALSNGNSHQVATMAEFVRRLVEALKTNLPLASALRLAGRSCQVNWLRRETEVMAHTLEETGALTTIQNTGVPPTVVYALSAGNDGGPNIRLLEEVIENYTDRVDTRFHWASGFLPIMAILVVGLAVALVVLALYWPLVSLIEGLTG